MKSIASKPHGIQCIRSVKQGMKFDAIGAFCYTIKHKSLYYARLGQNFNTVKKVITNDHQ